MADAKEAILFSCFVCGAVSMLCVQSEAAGSSHIFRHLCVYHHLRKQQHAKGQPSGMSSDFLAKTETNSWLCW